MPPLSDFLGPVQLAGRIDPLYSEAAKLSHCADFDPRIYLSHRRALSGIYPMACAARPHGRKDLPDKQGEQKSFQAKLSHELTNYLRRSNGWQLHNQHSSQCNSATPGRNNVATLASMSASIDCSDLPKLPEHNRDGAGWAHTTSSHSYAEEIAAVQENMGMHTPFDDIERGGMRAANARRHATEVVGRSGGYAGLNSRSKSDPESDGTFVSKHFFYLVDFGRSTLERVALIVKPTFELYYKDTLESHRAAGGVWAVMHALTSAKATTADPKGDTRLVGISLESLGLHAHEETDVVHSRLWHVALRLGAGGYDASQRMLMQMLQSCSDEGGVLV